MNNGYIKLYRKLTECWVWEEPDKLKAWLDLIMMANFKDKQLRNGGVIKRGQVATSEVKLAERWHWSRDKVRRFLRALNDTGMATTDKTAYGTVVTIVKYGFYQDADTADDTADNTPDETANDTADNTAVDTQKKKVKNDKNDNNYILSDSQEQTHLMVAVKQIIDHLNEKAGTKYRYSSKQTVSAIKARLDDKFSVDDFITVIDKKCAEWLGTDYEKYLTPDTLFRPGNFEKYLNQRIVAPKQQSPPKKSGCKYQNFPGRSQEERNEMLEEYRKAGLLA